jgi:hypothetical protein
MNNNSKNTDFMNTVALNQTLFKKFPVVGQGFSGGTRNIASTTPNGYILWVNGIHEMPNPTELLEFNEMGTIQYPHLISSMGDVGGEIKYWFGITQWEYILFAGVQLNPSFDDSDDHYVEVASLIFKDRVPIPAAEHFENYSEIAGELLLAHFTQFLGKNGSVEFKNSIQSDLNVFLSSVLDFYIEHADAWVNAILED